MTIETTIEKNETVVEYREIARELGEALSRFATRVTRTRLQSAMNRRVGALLRLSGVKLEVLPGRFKRLDDAVCTSQEIRLPLVCTDGDCTMRLEFMLSGLGESSRISILQTVLTIVKDLAQLTRLEGRTPAARSETDEAGEPTGPAPDRGDEVVDRAETRLALNDLSSRECRDHLEAFLSEARDGGISRRQKFTIRRSDSGTVNAEVEVASSDGSCEEGSRSADVQETGSYAPEHLPERLVHRLRNPLTTIMSCCSQLLDPEESSLSTTDRTLVGWVGTAAEAQNATINRYLQLYGSLQPTMRRLNLLEVLRAVIREHEATYSDRVAIISESESPFVWCDIYLLKQAISELVDNAVEAGGSGEVQIGWRAGEEHVTLTITNRLNSSQTIDKRASEPFFTGKPGHAGLGLPIALRYAAVQDGSTELLVHGGEAMAVLRLRLSDNGNNDLHVERT